MFATSLRFDPSVAYGTLLPHVDRFAWEDIERRRQGGYNTTPYDTPFSIKQKNRWRQGTLYSQLKRIGLCSKVALLEQTIRKRGGHLDRAWSITYDDKIRFYIPRNQFDIIDVSIGDNTGGIFYKYKPERISPKARLLGFHVCILDTVLSMTTDEILKMTVKAAHQKHTSLCLAAIAMAAHPRLGARSPLAMIVDADLLQEILRLSAC